MRISFYAVIGRIQEKEVGLSFLENNIIAESIEMMQFLQNLLHALKSKVITEGFSDNMEEIYFFKEIKPLVLSKLLFYNKLLRLEASCPMNCSQLKKEYFDNYLKSLKVEHEKYCLSSDFFLYYRSGRKDKDDVFFRLGNIDFLKGVNSFMFEVDGEFSTYYDYKLARILLLELLYEYLSQRLTSLSNNTTVISDLKWTDSATALVELIYALHASGCISNGRLGLKGIGSLSENVMNVKLNDMHHTFHRMKTRAGSRTIFLDELKDSLEKYMDKG